MRTILLLTCFWLLLSSGKSLCSTNVQYVKTEQILGLETYIANVIGHRGQNGVTNLSSTGTNTVYYTEVYTNNPYVMVQTYTATTNLITYAVISTTTTSATFTARTITGLFTNTYIQVAWATANILGGGASVPGTPGTPGAPGASGVGIQGPQGIQGTQGPATIGIAWYSNGVAGSSVIITNVGTTSNILLGFTIPVGEKGDTGTSSNTLWGTVSNSSARGDWFAGVSNRLAALETSALLKAGGTMTGALVMGTNWIYLGSTNVGLSGGNYANNTNGVFFHNPYSTSNNWIFLQ